MDDDQESPRARKRYKDQKAPAALITSIAAARNFGLAYPKTRMDPSPGVRKCDVTRTQCYDLCCERECQIALKQALTKRGEAKRLK